LERLPSASGAIGSNNRCQSAQSVVVRYLWPVSPTDIGIEQKRTKGTKRHSTFDHRNSLRGFRDLLFNGSRLGMIRTKRSRFTPMYTAMPGGSLTSHSATHAGNGFEQKLTKETKSRSMLDRRKSLRGFRDLLFNGSSDCLRLWVRSGRTIRVNLRNPWWFVNVSLCNSC
jgi:hypothetical protein